ncbi:hypothetical protein KIPB_010709 [Kipferlia bialata]|uniref:GIY-YIG domain-containing protein n=1 Tax=Kipferlia bialata TaxID=797122 RepID=A0A391NSB3_9EUKA|nr:hypothetical protein KIPB_010709 [Kipferlia bialata]|eukprot:g10709.t1
MAKRGSSRRTSASGSRKSGGGTRRKAAPKTKAVRNSSSGSTGLVTRGGKRVYNPAAYAATGAPTYNRYGKRIKHAEEYARAVQRNSATSTARKVHAKCKAAAYTYEEIMPNGLKYVGMSRHIERRVDQHHTGRGARVTQEVAPIRVANITPHRSLAAAKRAETQRYLGEARRLGTDRVRGAGNTARFSLK